MIEHVTHVAVGTGPFCGHLKLFLEIFTLDTVIDKLSDAKLAADSCGKATRL